ncbi:hypothetical protein MKX01_001142 [Papaver californicum]|nr:hypothetical protein MKX01_001142 [Papaver californicum]
MADIMRITDDLGRSLDDMFRRVEDLSRSFDDFMESMRTLMEVELTFDNVYPKKLSEGEDIKSHMEKVIVLDDEEVCSICLQDMNVGGDINDAVVLKCWHNSHEKCMLECSKRKPKSNCSGRLYQRVNLIFTLWSSNIKRNRRVNLVFPRLKLQYQNIFTRD